MAIITYLYAKYGPDSQGVRWDFQNYEANSCHCRIAKWHTRAGICEQIIEPHRKFSKDPTSHSKADEERAASS